MPSDISNPGIQPTAQPEDSPPPQCPSGDPVSHKVPALPCAADTASRPRPERLHLSSPGHFREERHQRGSGAREGSRSRDASGCPKTQLDTGTRFPLLPSGGQTWEQPPEVWKAASHHQLLYSGCCLPGQQALFWTLVLDVELCTKRTNPLPSRGWHPSGLHQTQLHGG